jgi:Ni/Co efflux regulator RcnB
MKRLVFALALVAAVGACKKAAQSDAAADSTKMMMSDSMKTMSDSMKAMDTTKH